MGYFDSEQVSGPNYASQYALLNSSSKMMSDGLKGIGSGMNSLKKAIVDDPFEAEKKKNTLNFLDAMSKTQNNENLNDIEARGMDMGNLINQEALVNYRTTKGKENTKTLDDYLKIGRDVEKSNINNKLKADEFNINKALQVKIQNSSIDSDNATRSLNAAKTNIATDKYNRTNEPKFIQDQLTGEFYKTNNPPAAQQAILFKNDLIKKANDLMEQKVATEDEIKKMSSQDISELYDSYIPKLAKDKKTYEASIGDGDMGKDIEVGESLNRDVIVSNGTAERVSSRLGVKDPMDIQIIKSKIQSITDEVMKDKKVKNKKATMNKIIDNLSMQWNSNSNSWINYNGGVMEEWDDIKGKIDPSLVKYIK